MKTVVREDYVRNLRQDKPNKNSSLMEMEESRPNLKQVSLQS